jgi:hypothetical protein
MDVDDDVPFQPQAQGAEQGAFGQPSQEQAPYEGAKMLSVSVFGTYGVHKIEVYSGILFSSRTARAARAATSPPRRRTSS